MAVRLSEQEVKTMLKNLGYIPEDAPPEQTPQERLTLAKLETEKARAEQIRAKTNRQSHERPKADRLPVAELISLLIAVSVVIVQFIAVLLLLR